MALAHGYALPFVTQKVVGDYASDNAAATARAIASGATKEAAGSCLDARAINLQMRVPQRTDTNLLTNSAMAGATGSVLPTKWVSGSVSGLTVTISSAFTSAGFQAIDWTVSGTAAQDGTIYIGCEPNDNTNAIAASIGQQYIGAMSLGKQAGTIPATMVLQVLGQKSSDGSINETANNTTELATLTSSSLTRINTAVLSIANVNSDRVNFRLTADVAALDVISFTIRIAAPQVERNDRISPYITTTQGAASRVTGRPSVLIVPQLTKAGTVYPQLPTVSGADFTFTRATTATRVNASGLIESVASGVLRLDYPIGGGCPAALIEASGTNLAFRSEEFNVSGTWVPVSGGTGSNPAVTANAVISPDGTQNAETVVFNRGAGNTSSDLSLLFQAITLAVSGTYTFSVYVKATTLGDVGKQIYLRAGTGATLIAYTLTSSWVRLSRTETSLASGSSIFQIGNRGTFTVDNSVSVDLWGAQVETGAIPTSYIPTTTAAVTRAADVCTVSGVSGYIGQTEGTIYAEVDMQRLQQTTIFTIDVGGTSEFISILKFATGSFRVFIKKSSSSQVNILSSAANPVGIYKIAVGYKNGDYALYVNGSQAATSNNSTDYPTGALSRALLSDTTYGVFNDRLRAAAIYTTRLTNDQLANLTRLT